MDVTARATRSLSLKVVGNKTIFKYGEPIPTKLYRSQAYKNEYEIKLCQITINAYARIERMNELKNKSYTPSLYDILKSNEVSSCIKKTIAITPGSSIANFDVNRFLLK